MTYIVKLNQWQWCSVDCDLRDVCLFLTYAPQVTMLEYWPVLLHDVRSGRSSNLAKHMVRLTGPRGWGLSPVGAACG